MLRLAVIQAPALAKSWHCLANWALEVGEANMTAASVKHHLDQERSKHSKDSFKVAQDELEVLESLLENSLDGSEWMTLVEIMHKVKISGGDGDQESVMTKALKDLPFHDKIPNIDLVVQLWKGIRTRGKTTFATMCCYFVID